MDACNVDEGDQSFYIRRDTGPGTLRFGGMDLRKIGFISEMSLVFHGK